MSDAGEGSLRSILFRTLLCFGLLILGRQPLANADLLPAPVGLSETALLQRAVFTSDGILIATVIRTTDSTRTPDYAFHRIYAVVRPLRWLRGSAGSEPIVVYLSDQSGAQYRMLHAGESSPTAFTIFMQSWHSDWYLNHDENIAGGGVTSVTPAQVTLAADRIAQTILDQSLDSLSVQSDAIVLAAPIPSSRYLARSARPQGHYTFFGVDSVLAGSVSDSVIAVTSPYLPDLNERGVLFLKRQAPHTYEALSAGAGAVAVRSRMLPRFGLTVDEAATKIRLARARRAGVQEPR